MSTGPFVSSYDTVTLMGLINQFQSLAALQYNVALPSTINSKHQTRAGQSLPVNATVRPTKIPTIKYFGIGIGGSYNVDDGNLTQPYKPKATNMDMFTPIPFRCVPITNDLSAIERANYRIRTQEVLGGVSYYCYWLKPITFVDTSVRVTLVDPSDNTQSTYTIDNANLTPTPTRLSSTDVVNANASRIVVAVTGTVSIYGSEVIEYVNARYGGDMRYAKVDEFGCYTGEDRKFRNSDDGLIALPDDSATDFYTDAVYVQLAKHKCTIGEDFSSPTKQYSEDIVFESGSIILS